ncbi:MAG: hypothetical protein H7Y22_18955, partial [Gemmatimonadaceae bacterium]|nr:hypothetical protein [Gloeobacterales cyanobacterium ES-bin-141]
MLPPQISPIRVHLELRVSDLSRSIAFYQTVLAVVPVHEQAYALFCAHGLELLLYEGQVSPVRFGFRLSSAADLVSLEQFLHSRELEPVRREFYHPGLGVT